MTSRFSRAERLAINVWTRRSRAVKRSQLFAERRRDFPPSDENLFFFTLATIADAAIYFTWLFKCGKFSRAVRSSVELSSEEEQKYEPDSRSVTSHHTERVTYISARSAFGTQLLHHIHLSLFIIIIIIIEPASVCELWNCISLHASPYSCSPTFPSQKNQMFERAAFQTAIRVHEKHFFLFALTPVPCTASWHCGT